MSARFNKLLLAAVLCVGAFATSACSNQWRESDPGVDDVYVNQLFQEMAGSGGELTASFNNSVLQLDQDPYATLYFAESGPAMGEVPSIMSFQDTSWLGNLGGQQIPIGTSIFDLISDYGLSKVSVIFYDGFGSDDQRYFTLMLKLETSNGTSYFKAQSTDFQISAHVFSVDFQLNDGSYLTLSSHDISPDTQGELAGTIKLDATIDDGSGIYDIGQFSVLHGFGGQQ
jgi:hypothetical protein